MVVFAVNWPFRFRTVLNLNGQLFYKEVKKVMDILAKRLMKIAKMVLASKYEYSSSGDAAKESLEELNDLISKNEREIYGLFGAFLFAASPIVADDTKFKQCVDKISHSVSRENVADILQAVKYIKDVADKMEEDIYSNEWISRHYNESQINKWKSLLWDLSYAANEAESGLERYIDSSFYGVEINYNGQTPSEFFEVEADDEVTALEMSVALCEKNGLFGLLESPEEFDELDEDEKEDYIEVDGSSFGASHPWYVRSDLVDIRAI